MQHYLIAKYVDDVRRNEPVNVGVVVFGGGQVAARFEGEDEQGRLDKRRIRKRVSGRDAYVAWVQHWRRLVAAHDEQALLRASSQDFYLEPGGTIVLDLDERGIDDAVRELYSRLVKPDDPPAPMSLQEKSLRTLRLAGADLEDDSRFQTDISVKLDVHGQTFHESVSYGVRNGAWHYLQEVAFDPQRPRRSRKEANHCAFLMEHALIDGERLVLYDGADIDETTAPLLDLLTAIVPVVDVGDVDGAVSSLRSKLHLGAGTASN
jgi:hypothetical protein